MEPGLPKGEDAKDLLILKGETLATLLKLIPGMPEKAVDLGKALISYTWRRWKRRVETFADGLGRHPGAIQRLAESEPLLDVFMSMFDACLRDEEDEKVQYYAAFTAGLAGQIERYPSAMRLAMLQAVKSLRTHDLRLLALIKERPGMTVQQLLGEGDQLPQLMFSSLGALQNQGLVVETLPSEEGDITDDIIPVTREDRSYEVTELGAVLWSLIDPNLV